jgi:6-phosphogluconolactonase
VTNERRVLVAADKETLAAAIAARFITKTVDILDDQETADIVLTGGSLGIMVLAAINESSARDTIDWSRISFWWGDERWLDRDDPERNELQARTALLDHIDVPAGSIHPFASADDGIDLDAAAVRYADELAAASCSPGSTSPSSASGRTATSPLCSLTWPVFVKRMPR